MDSYGSRLLYFPCLCSNQQGQLVRLPPVLALDAATAAVQSSRNASGTDNHSYYDTSCDSYAGTIEFENDGGYTHEGPSGSRSGMFTQTAGAQCEYHQLFSP